MTDGSPPPDRHLLGRWAPWIVLVVIVATLGVLVFVWRESGRDRGSAGLSEPFVYDVERYRHIPAGQIGYREIATVETGMAQVTALAAGPEGEIVVGGDRVVRVYGPDGAARETIPVEETPLALATTPEGGLLVAGRSTVAERERGGPFRRLITLTGERVRITSIALDRDSVYVADAGTPVVWRFTRRGELVGRIGEKDPDRNIPDFNVPSPYFDLLVAPDGLLRVVDPGRHRITAFTPEGDLELAWGLASLALPGFGGCCNPSHLAMLPDGRFVTSEKGIPRVKVHDAEGEFVTAVVGAEGLATETGPCDVAVDPKGRILVLDPGARAVRIYVPKGGQGR
jgi:sugar lactone lactonase YvrE